MQFGGMDIGDYQRRKSSGGSGVIMDTEVFTGGKFNKDVPYEPNMLKSTNPKDLKESGNLKSKGITLYGPSKKGGIDILIEDLGGESFSNTIVSSNLSEKL
jgi:hypothetical protein